MDNAQKAIMIGVGLFITIIIIAAVMLITGMGQNLLNKGQAQVEGISESLMNDLVAQYDGKTMSGSQVRTAAVQLANRSDANISVVIKDSSSDTSSTTVNSTTSDINTSVNTKLKGKDTKKYDGSVTNTSGSVTVTFTGK